jgi:hypothetical protein
MKDENGELLEDSHNILNNFSQLLNVHSIVDIGQMEVHTAEPLLSDPSPFEVEIANTQMKKCTSPGTDQILAELIRTRSETLLSEIRKLVYSIWNKDKLLDYWKESIILSIHKKQSKN